MMESLAEVKAEMLALVERLKEKTDRAVQIAGFQHFGTSLVPHTLRVQNRLRELEEDVRNI